MPVGHVLVGHPAGHVEHDDGALALDVVAVPGTGNKINLVEMCNILREKKTHNKEEEEQGYAPESAELLLAGRIPNVKPDRTAVRVEHQRMNLGG